MAEFVHKHMRLVPRRQLLNEPDDTRCASAVTLHCTPRRFRSAVATSAELHDDLRLLSRHRLEHEMDAAAVPSIYGRHERTVRPAIVVVDPDHTTWPCPAHRSLFADDSNESGPEKGSRKGDAVSRSSERPATSRRGSAC
jgi:hypothetical protein